MRKLPALVLAAFFPLYGQGLVGGCQILPTDNIWNTAIDKLAPMTNSDVLVDTIGRGSTVHADFGAGRYQGAPIGIPYVLVPGSQTKYPVVFQYADESDPGPYAIPLNAPIEGGKLSNGDRHTLSIETTNCVLYELYRAYPRATSWLAGSGAIFDLSSNALRPAGWTSADAAGLPIFAGLLLYDDVASGEIRHAIRFTAPQTRDVYVWPARHEASSLTDPKYPAMGQRFRMKSGYDISRFSAANQVILRALKKYGMILADNGSSWYLSGSPDNRWNNDDLHALGTIPGDAFEAVDATVLMIDPNSGQAKQN